MERNFRFFYFLAILIGMVGFSPQAFATSPLSEKASSSTPEVKEVPPSYVAFCGNGHIDPGEACDLGDQNGIGPCTPHCQLEISVSLGKCRNGQVETQYGEECDDGNLKDGDGCSSDCHSEISQVNPNQPVHVPTPSDPSDPNSDPTPSDPTTPTNPNQPGPITQEGNSNNSATDGSSGAAIPSLKGVNSGQQVTGNSAVMEGGCSLASSEGSQSPLTLGFCLLPFFWVTRKKMCKKF